MIQKPGGFYPGFFFKLEGTKVQFHLRIQNQQDLYRKILNFLFLQLLAFYSIWATNALTLIYYSYLDKSHIQMQFKSYVYVVVTNIFVHNKLHSVLNLSPISMQFGNFSVTSLLKNRGNSTSFDGKFLNKSYFYLIIPEYIPQKVSFTNFNKFKGIL